MMHYPAIAELQVLMSSCGLNLQHQGPVSLNSSRFENQTRRSIRSKGHNRMIKFSSLKVELAVYKKIMQKNFLNRSDSGFTAVVAY